MKTRYTANGHKADIIVALTEDQAEQLEAVVALLAPIYGPRSKSLVVRKALSAYLPAARQCQARGSLTVSHLGTVIIGSAGMPADEEGLPSNAQLFGGASNPVASTRVIPQHPGRDGFDERLAIQPLPGVGTTTKGDGLIEVGGLEISVSQAIAAGLVTKDADGTLRPTEAFINSKMAEAQAANWSDDAMAMIVADEATDQFVEAADTAAEAAGIGGLHPLVHAILKAEDANSILDIVTPVASQMGVDPKEATGNLLMLIDTFGDNAAQAMGLSREAFDEAFDAAVRTHGLQRVVGAAMDGARRRTFTPLVRTLRGQV